MTPAARNAVLAGMCCAALVGTPRRASAMQCHPNAESGLAALRAHTGQRIVATAKAGDGRLIITADPSEGDWTMHAVDPTGRICMIGRGTDWTSDRIATGAPA